MQAFKEPFRLLASHLQQWQQHGLQDRAPREGGHVDSQGAGIDHVVQG